MADKVPKPLELEAGVTAVAALLVALRDDAQGVSARPTEAVLADAGLSLAEIAQLTGRKYETVKTNLRRHRERATKGGTT